MKYQFLSLFLVLTAFSACSRSERPNLNSNPLEEVVVASSSVEREETPEHSPLRIVSFGSVDPEDGAFQVSIESTSGYRLYRYVGQSPTGGEILTPQYLAAGTYRMRVVRMSGTKRHGRFRSWLFSGWNRNIAFNSDVHPDRVEYDYTSNEESSVPEHGYQWAKVELEVNESIVLEFHVH